MTSYDYVEPTTIEEAVELLVEHGEDAHLIAGGTSLILMLRQQLLSPTTLIGLRAIPELRGIRRRDDRSLEIGAMATHRQIELSPEVQEYAEALAATFGHVATVRIRNQGTIGGNLAHADPAQDPPPILLAVDAIVRIVGPHGVREIPIADLFVDYFETSLEPAEVITGVVLPPRAPGANAVYVKYLPGSKDDYATVSVAVSGTRKDGGWTDVRIACGAAGPVPMRIPAAEDVLEGTMIEAPVIEHAAQAVAEAVDPFADVRGSPEYKRQMAAVWTGRALRKLVSHPRPTAGDGA